MKGENWQCGCIGRWVVIIVSFYRISVCVSVRVVLHPIRIFFSMLEVHFSLFVFPFCLVHSPNLDLI